MNANQFKEARQTLGLSVNQLSKILNVNPVTIRRWEMTSGKSASRDPHPTACQVLRWLQSGQLSF